MEKVARVVKSPATSELYFLSKDPEDTVSERFIIQDSPESIPIKGMSFTVAPEGDEQEIAAWSVLSCGTSDSRPPSGVVWRWYSDRADIEISDKHKLDIFQFSLWNDVPYFYWIKGLKAQLIKEALLNALRIRPSNVRVTPILIVASFLGEKFYSKVLTETGDYKSKLPPAMQKFPQTDPKETFGKIRPGAKETQRQLEKKQLSVLNNIAKEVERTGKKPGLSKVWKAQKIDCFLYAQDDQYL